MRKVGIVCCSNGQNREVQPQLDAVAETLREFGMEAVFSPYLYETDGVRSAGARERAGALMRFYEEKEVEAVCDISGGDIANEILPYLDYDKIAASPITFYGYSDLTTVLNAIYTRTGKEGGLYQLKNIVGREGKETRRWRKKEEAARQFQKREWDFSYEFLRGTQMEGVVVGGNIRCFLKLAGTAYLPDFEGKILLLEGLGGMLPQMITYLSQLEQLGAFQKAAGILLGTFTKIAEEGREEQLYGEVLKISGGLAVARTKEIGHGEDAKCCMIGRRYRFG